MEHQVNVLTNWPDGPGRANVRWAWWMIGIGMAAGGLMGLWSFGGPLPPPRGFEAFDDLPRRLLRLAHVASIALPVLNLLYVPWIGRTRLHPRVRGAGCRLLLAGTVLLPALLALAAWVPPALLVLPLPVLCLLSAVFLLAGGLPRGEKGGRP